MPKHATLSGNTIPVNQLGTGTPDGTKYLRDDGQWTVPPGGGGATWGGITGTLSAQTDLQSALDGKAATGHTHAQLHDPVTVVDTSSINLTLSAQQISADAIFGTTAGTICQGNDSRLSDARTPLAHNQAWSTITGTPTTLSGYGITDAVPSSRTVSTSAPLSGGGALSGNLTLSVGTFGAAAAGVVPASGGGTSNFLRADGTWAAPGGGGGADPWTYIKLSSDFVTSSATAVDVTGLEFTPAANKTYQFEGMFLLRTATATVGPRPGLAWATGLTDGSVRFFTPSSATANLNTNGNISAAVLVAVGGLPSTTGSWLGTMDGVVVAGATPSGTIKVQLASETGGTNVTMKAGSFLRYREI